MAVLEDVGMDIKMYDKCFKEIIELENGKHIDETELNGLIDFVNHRYDCADFRMIVLKHFCHIKIYYPKKP
jgi:hypothetical protein